MRITPPEYIDGEIAMNNRLKQYLHDYGWSCWWIEMAIDKSTMTAEQKAVATKMVARLEDGLKEVAKEIK